jgi:hypothetical protein
MEDNQIKSALDGIRYPVTAIKDRRTRLRHDHAIERVDVAVVGTAPKPR